MRHCCQLYTRVVLSKNFSFSPDALWRCCSYWFHLCEHSLYSNSELKAPPCPHLIRLLERYSASVKFLQPRQRHCSMKLKPSDHNSLCCLNCCGLLCDCRAHRYLDKRFLYFFFLMDSFYVFICCHFITVYFGFVHMCMLIFFFFLSLSVHMRVFACVYVLCIYCLHECTGYAHTRLHIHVL